MGIYHSVARFIQSLFHLVGGVTGVNGATAIYVDVMDGVVVGGGDLSY